MKKTAITLLAALFVVACGNSKQADPKPADSTQTKEQDSRQGDNIIGTDRFTFDLDNGVLMANGVRYEFAHVEAGTFTMGASADAKDAEANERPAHKVTLTHDYYIGKTEVTWALWKAVMGSYPHDAEGQGEENPGAKHPDRFPVDNVSLEQCILFANTLSSFFGECDDFHVPTEAEWEFAARGGNKSKGFVYSGSNNIADVAWYDENAGSGTHAVGTKKPNELGLYDMTGNVCEWCTDIMGAYSSKAQTDPKGPENGDGLYVLRGGNCFYDAANCRLTRRSADLPDNDDNAFYGLRLVYVHTQGH